MCSCSTFVKKSVDLWTKLPNWCHIWTLGPAQSLFHFHFRSSTPCGFNSLREWLYGCLSQFHFHFRSLTPCGFNLLNGGWLAAGSINEGVVNPSGYGLSPMIPKNGWTNIPTKTNLVYLGDMNRRGTQYWHTAKISRLSMMIKNNGFFPHLCLCQLLGWKANRI